MEYKTVPYFTKNIEGRTVTGIAAVHGHIDSGNDLSVNGSFAKRLADGSRKRQRFLWNHDSRTPPIATIKSIREVGREELPSKVLEYAPEATGGIEITREYYQKEESELAHWVYSAVSKGDVEEMSYAYEIHDFEYKEVDGRTVRILKDVETWDFSDVLWGMNDSTVAIKNLYGLTHAGDGMTFMQHSDAVVSAVKEYVERVADRRDFRAKEGRVLSTANRERIKALLDSLATVSDDLKQLLTDTEPKADPAAVNRLYAEFLHLETQLLGAIQ